MRRTAEEEDIELTVRGAVTEEVVVGVVVEGEAVERVLGEEVVEDGGAADVVRVDVGVAPNVDGDVGGGGETLRDHGIEGGEGEGELEVAAVCGEVEADMDAGGDAGDGEEEGEE